MCAHNTPYFNKIRRNRYYDNNNHPRIPFFSPCHSSTPRRPSPHQHPDSYSSVNSSDSSFEFVGSPGNHHAAQFYSSNPNSHFQGRGSTPNSQYSPWSSPGNSFAYKNRGRRLNQSDNSFNVEDYVSTRFLEDPWARLRSNAESKEIEATPKQSPPPEIIILEL